MANEYIGTMIDVDASGNERTLYPKTKIAAVEDLQTELDDKASKTHSHDASDIKTGVLPVERGGTGAANATAARSALGLSKVENKSSADIRGEITKENISSALGYTPADPSTSVGTVDSALSSSSTNPVQNKVVNSALSGKAPTSHASSATTYGVGTGSNYGHVKLSDLVSSNGVSTGTAATPLAVKVAYDLANTAKSAAATAQTTADGKAAKDLSNVDNSVLTNKLAAAGINKITVDSALSSTSTNPVQNKVVNAALANKADNSALAAYLPKTGGDLTGGLGIKMDWGGYYLKDSSGRDGFFEKNSNTGAVNLGNLKDANNGQFITVNPETGDLADAVTLTRNVGGASTTHRIPTYSYGTEDLTAGTSPLESGKLYFVYE